MTEIKKLIKENKNEDAFKSTAEAMERIYEEINKDRSPIVGDMSALFQRPSGNELMTWILENLKDLKKSQEDSAKESIKLSRKLNSLTWVIIILIVVIVGLAVFNLPI